MHPLHPLATPMVKSLRRRSINLCIIFKTCRQLLGLRPIWTQRGSVDPKFQVEWVAPSNHSFSRKTRLNDLSYGVKILTDFSSVLSPFTRLTDGRTDGQTEFSLLDRVCIPCMTSSSAIAERPRCRVG